MLNFIRDFRVIPIVLFASASLFALKMIGILTDGGYTLGAGHLAQTDRLARESARIVTTQLLRPPAIAEAETQPAATAPQTKLSWAQEMFGYPDITGSVSNAKPFKDSGQTKPVEATASAPKPAEGKPAEGKPGEAKAEAKPANPPPAPNGVLIPLDKPMSPAERAVLERLGERRQELDQRAKEMEMRETLLAAAEKRLEARVNDMKEAEARIKAASARKDEADVARFKSIVTMYESMKAKEAAKIFDRLDIKLATEVASLINPRRMSDILAQMTPETAERLTVELANRNAAPDKANAAADLPKIEGKVESKPNGT